MKTNELIIKFKWLSRNSRRNLKKTQKKTKGIYAEQCQKLIV